MLYVILTLQIYFVSFGFEHIFLYSVALTLYTFCNKGFHNFCVPHSNVT